MKMSFKQKYSIELYDITKSSEKKLLYIGEVKGRLMIYYDKEIPKSFDLVTINWYATGIHSLDMTFNGKSLELGFGAKSFYFFLSSLEYIKGYSNLFSLKIEKIEITISGASKKEVDITLERNKYDILTEPEQNDIRDSKKIERIFSGDLDIEYNISYAFSNESESGSGHYSSIYSFLPELEQIRRNRGTKLIKYINLTLSRLNNSRIWYHKILEKYR
ncbi:MAG: hypothetical protein ACFFG0_29695 [Candidatus Thorarchaeota archaeon]